MKSLMFGHPERRDIFGRGPHCHKSLTDLASSIVGRAESELDAHWTSYAEELITALIATPAAAGGTGGRRRALPSDLSE